MFDYKFAISKHDKSWIFLYSGAPGQAEVDKGIFYVNVIQNLSSPV